jgi:uncharacterized protein (DUF2252 family)
LTPIEPARRAEILERRRTAKMASSAHAYVRGNTVLFYEWLAGLDAASLPTGPAIWICGDCHVGNLGPLADAEGHVDIQIRDLDQTVVGNPAHDLIRLGLSLASAARGADLPGITTARMLEEMVKGYTLALRRPEAGDIVPEPDVVKTVRRRALGRRWKELARERLADVKPTIPLGSRYWALSEEERSGLQALFQRQEVADLVLALNARDREGEVELIDAAYWVKGCSSLGKLRFAALVEMRGKGKVRDRIALVDLKEGVEAAAPAAHGAQMPVHHGERVVEGARALSPNLGERMMAADLLGRPVILRELMPQDLKLEIDQFSRTEAVQAARYLAYVVGRAHARQLDEGDRDAWRREMERQRDGDLDAPHWLWSSVVALAAEHERGYLEHCRRYALTAA